MKFGTCLILNKVLLNECMDIRIISLPSALALAPVTKDEHLKIKCIFTFKNLFYVLMNRKNQHC